VSSESISSFAQLGLSDPVLRAVFEVGYEAPSPIQAAAIPALLAGGDILGQAQTGTGKTAAFALPLLSRLDLTRAKPQVLVLTPTRELAIQVAEAFQTYARYLSGFHVLPIYGGQSYSLQLRPLRRGVHVVVGTPGRVLDHLRRGTLSMEHITGMVLDEADEMLRMGFIDDVESILKQTPEGKQLALFSATLPGTIRKIAERHTRNPVTIRIEAATATVATVRQRYWEVRGVHKLDALTRILETEDFEAMVVFVRTKSATVELADRLEARGFSSAALNGDMNQSARELTVERLKSNRLDILVATDVAARGLDVERVSHVINYDIPYDTEAYVHRIGRTARAGRKGDAILFVAPRERRMLRSIERATGQPITPMTIPSPGDVADRRVERFKSSISDIIASQDLKPFEAMVESYHQEHGVALGEVAAALAFMAQGEKPLLPAPKAQSDRPSRNSDARSGEQPRREQPRREQATRETPPQKSPRRAPPARKPPGDDRVRYRIEVGSTHGVQPKNIVGAIANEAGLDSEFIGPIDIHDEFSTVDLPDGMPKDLFNHLKKVWICGRRLQISVAGSAGADGSPKRPHKSTESAGKPERAPHKRVKGKRKKKPKRDKKRDSTKKGHEKP
jgi:ATP-dependent RNA helicase DeaD